MIEKIRGLFALLVEVQELKVRVEKLERMAADFPLRQEPETQEQHEARPLLKPRRSWPQFRTWLEHSDGGRVKLGKD